MVEEILNWAEGKAEGRAEGKAEDILDLLEDIGAVAEDLKKKLYDQKDIEVLREWHKLAARAQSIEEFMQRISGDVQV